MSHFEYLSVAFRLVSPNRVTLRYLWLVLVLIGHVPQAFGDDAVCADFDKDSTATPTLLFDSAVLCMSEKEAQRGSRLMILGQMRALVDLTLFPPKDDPAKKIATRLYSRLYYQLGGSGPDEFITNSESFIELIDYISAWEPENLQDYEPDWEYESAPSHERYLLEVERTKIFRIKQLMSFRRHLLEEKD